MGLRGCLQVLSIMPSRHSTGLTALTIAAAVAAGCATAPQRMAEDARVCDRAMEIGNLEMAEDYCRRALGEPGSGVLSPAVESRRLLTLGRLLRQRAQYAQALELMTRSLALEQRRQAPDPTALAVRQVELALIHAGRGDWSAGASSLEASLEGVHGLAGADRETAAHVLRQYARHTRAGTAARFRRAAQALEAPAPSGP